MVESSREKQKIVNTNNTVSWIAEDIILIEWKSETEIDESDIDELSEAFQELTQGRIVKVLQDFGRYTSITSQARDYAAKKSPEVKALGYIIMGLGQRMIIRFYMNLKKRKYPTKVFMSREEGLDWLKSVE